MSIIDSEDWNLALAGIYRSFIQITGGETSPKLALSFAVRYHSHGSYMGKKNTNLFTLKKKTSKVQKLQTPSSVKDSSWLLWWRVCLLIMELFDVLCAEMSHVYRQLFGCIFLTMLFEPQRNETAGICRKNPSSISRLDGKWDRLGFKCRGFLQPP